MASRVYLAWPYLLPRFALWALLLVVAIIDGERLRGQGAHFAYPGRCRTACRLLTR